MLLTVRGSWGSDDKITTYKYECYAFIFPPNLRPQCTSCNLRGKKLVVIADFPTKGQPPPPGVNGVFSLKNYDLFKAKKSI